MKTIKKEKQNKRMPIGMILLSVFLIWNLFKQLGIVLSGRTSLDANIPIHYNLLGLGSILFFIMIFLNTFSIYTIFYKKRWGYKILISFFILSILLIIFMYTLSISDVEVLREFALRSRIERGLSTKGIDFAINSIILGLSSLLNSIFYLVLIYYVHKKREYFSK